MNRVHWAMTGKMSACLALFLAATAQGQDGFKGLPMPKVGEERVHAKVRSIDPVKFFIEVETESVWNSKGDEKFFGKPQTRGYLLEGGVKISRVGEEGTWLPLSAVKEGEACVLMIQLPGSGQAQSVKQIWVDAPAKKRPAQRNDAVRALTEARSGGSTVDPDGVSNEQAVVPLIFPIVGKVRWSDTFLASRGGGTRRHHGQDLMAAKMTPLVACFDGTVRITARGSHNYLTIVGPDGWSAVYMHINNDTPGTDDGKGTANYAFAPGLKSGDQVVAGQFVAWVGDSGNAEGTAPHLHFELHTPEGNVVNAVWSLNAATRIDRPIVVNKYQDLKSENGQIRLDGIVRLYDKARGVLVIDLLARDEGSGLECVASPSRRYVVLKEAATEPSDWAAKTVEGRAVIVLGSDPGDGNAVQASRVLFE